ncbi:hypothetical protein [Gaoshiqia sp. Z1-71]|uniref:hypothetical protein n=1 Tax=Gaoshiqia hydrogeniformans TaxID=3290090 RepID=UPI003BF88C10
MKKASGKIFYGKAYLYFSVAAIVTVLAFFPSYFNRLTETDGAHHFHGITATLWILLLVVQPFLYQAGKFDWHRKLGKVSFVLVPLIIISALNMVHVMLSGDSYSPGLAYRLAFIDFFTLIQFLLFFLLAIVYRHNIQLHARYMACTVLGPMIPALTRLFFRIPLIDNFDKSLNASYILIDIVLLILLVDDKRSGKIRSPYVLAFILMAIQHVLMNFVAQWEWWRVLMDAFSRL